MNELASFQPKITKPKRKESKHTPSPKTAIPTIGYSQYGKLVSPFPPGGLINGATSKKHWAARKKNGTMSQVLKGRGRFGSA